MDFVGADQSDTEISPQLKLLVVDDDVLSQRMMRLLLTREGHEVDIASSGVEALELIKLSKYDIVFMDLQMPGMDGIESSRLIRAWENGGQHTFIVALTASYLPEHGQILFDAGIDNYISKPFELEHIQRLLNYSVKAGRATHIKPPALEHEFASGEVLATRKGIDQVGGDGDSYRELLHEFIEGLPERLKIIQQFYMDMDLEELARAAHNLSGVAASLGAVQLSDCARKLDKQSSEGYTESVALLLQEIQLVAGTLLEFSNSFLAEKKRSAGSA